MLSFSQVGRACTHARRHRPEIACLKVQGVIDLQLEVGQEFDAACIAAGVRAETLVQKVQEQRPEGGGRALERCAYQFDTARSDVGANLFAPTASPRIEPE
jgi:hypothetical protein